MESSRQIARSEVISTVELPRGIERNTIQGRVWCALATAEGEHANPDIQALVNSAANVRVLRRQVAPLWKVEGGKELQRQFTEACKQRTKPASDAALTLLQRKELSDDEIATYFETGGSLYTLLQRAVQLSNDAGDKAIIRDTLAKASQLTQESPHLHRCSLARRFIIRLKLILSGEGGKGIDEYLREQITEFSLHNLPLSRSDAPHTTNVSTVLQEFRQGEQKLFKALKQWQSLLQNPEFEISFSSSTAEFSRLKKELDTLLRTVEQFNTTLTATTEQQFSDFLIDSCPAYAQGLQQAGKMMRSWEELLAKLDKDALKRQFQSQIPDRRYIKDAGNPFTQLFQRLPRLSLLLQKQMKREKDAGKQTSLFRATGRVKQIIEGANKELSKNSAS